MKRFTPIFLVFPFLLGACGALGAPVVDATPTISSEEIRATADVMVYDMLTQTQAAIPTNTIVSPTNTPLPPPTATLTIVPTLDAILASPTISVNVATVAPSAIPLAAVANTLAPGRSCMDQLLTGWTGESAQLSVSNNVKNTTANVFLCIITEADEIGYLNIPLVKSNSAAVPQGCYSATAWVSGEYGQNNFNATTTFCIKDAKSWELVIDKGSLTMYGGCYPNC